MVTPADFTARGWAKFASDARVLDWVTHARPFAEQAINDPAHAQWLQCEGTWFVGVDALPNDAFGRLDGGPVLAGPALDLWRAMGREVPPLHRAQISVTYPGYPRPRDGESEGAFRYRLNRDAAHVDGLLPVGPDRARQLKEPHAFILGMPMTRADAGAAPLVVWDGSHHIIARHLRAALDQVAPKDQGSFDLTAPYHAARREVFESCTRIELPAQPGESVLLHHLSLHGVAPWKKGATSEKPGRMIAYFRPEWASGITDWLTKG